MATGIDALIISKDEKTFQFQNDLLSLPIPNLQHTLDRYLDSVKPHVTEEEFKKTEALCQDFAAGEGKMLHEKLLEVAQKKRNWLEKWWEDAAYLEGRLPNPLMNMAGPGPYYFDVWKPEPGSLIPRAAFMLYHVVNFWQLVRREQIAPHKDGQGRPLCMHQFRKLLSTCNIPGVHQDHIVNHFKTESEGSSPSFVAVMCKGRVWRLECVDEAGATLSPPELQAQLQWIYNKAASLPQAPAVSYFTSLERTQWAKVRSRLLAVHPDNFNSLQTIESAVVVFGLEDYCPPDMDDLCLQALLGDASTRWFDKSMTFVGYGNGTFISNCDHSPMDGMMLVSSTYYTHCKILESDGVWKGHTGVRQLPEPEQLVFHLDSQLHQSLEEAKRLYSLMRGRVEIEVLVFTDYGKKSLKPHRAHPDTCVQLALQLAYYRMYKKPAATYETATTRQFYHGRTETVRSCTPESTQWCQAMVRGDNSVNRNTEQYQLFKSAMDKQNKLMEESTNLQGCDRHLFGLGMTAREEGLPVPSIFKDPAFYKSGGGGNFKLSTSCLGYTTVFGSVAPMCPDGYGTFYNIRDDRVVLCITTWTADQNTSSKTFATEVSRALRDILHLLEMPKAPVARL